MILPSLGLRLFLESIVRIQPIVKTVKYLKQKEGFQGFMKNIIDDRVNFRINMIIKEER